MLAAKLLGEKAKLEAKKKEEERIKLEQQK
jgi:hypothetical protein